jgi:signal transduction histidine kinase
MGRPTTLPSSIARIAAFGVLFAVAVGAAGVVLTRSRLGADDRAAVQRVEDELGQRFRDAADALSARAALIAADPAAMTLARRDSGATRDLFRRLADMLAEDRGGAAGLTVYAANGTPVAWAGRVSDLPRDRIDGPSSLFVTLDALGPRLVRVEAVADPARPSARLGTVIAEQLVAQRVDVASTVSDTFRLPTSVAEVSVRATPGLAPPEPPYSFAIVSSAGQVLAEAELSPTDLAATRARWRARTIMAMLVVLSATVLLCSAPVLERRRRAARPGMFLTTTALLVGALVAARLLLDAAFSALDGTDIAGVAELLPNALLLVALVWLALDTMERRRVSQPRVPLLRRGTGTQLFIVVVFACAGAAGVSLLWGYERMLAGIATRASQDLVRFSLHPFEPPRIGVVAALVLLHAAVIWGAAGVLRLPAVLWRTARSDRRPIVVGGSILVGALTAGLVAHRYTAAVASGPLSLAFATAALAALLLSRPRGTARRASQAARLGLVFLGLAIPALALYPSLDALAVRAKERLVTNDLAPLVASQREDLQVRRLPLTLEAIDAMPTLAEFVTSSSEDAAPTTDRAFIIWSQTELANTRTTSAVELYGASGRLVSRFALDLPEYAPTEYRHGDCTEWELYEEVSPFGSTLRNVLRASRAICAAGQRLGGIVVRAQLDYRALPFVSSPYPYLESLLPRDQVSAEAAFGSDVELAFYGWSRAPLYASGTRVWPLDDSVFQQMTDSRDGVWRDVERDGDSFRVFFFNDRGGIYALGYPVVTWFGHVINLAELAFFCGVLYLVLLVGATLFNTLTSQTPASGRALLREVRSSFYRKLFIAFVIAAVAPVVVLAVATSTYFANQFRAGVEESAVKTATVAQRLIEDYVALQQRGAGTLDRIDDEFMLTVRRAIDEDVNLFDGPRLRATSERPLFASRLLPARTPADVYRSIRLDRLPTVVVVEKLGGEPGYLLAAAPVRAGAREGIVTVPQTLRQREIEQQIDELDRRVLSAAVLFVLLGAALGYWMAERIADPVSRLSRATRRIARGDLDARIAATSSDELRRLVQDFNRMADDLKRQRANLERTQRLEAWADMARQVAHDIKNPLTPIQLSAEHAYRVNVDRGRPLSPALDECVSSILSQVKLLRQISSEFSSFASSPTARPEPTSIGDLLAEVTEPYRTGLSQRVELIVDAEPRLPMANIDRTLFGRALTNVIENALHAMPGGGRLTIRAYGVPAATAGEDRRIDRIAVDVVDTGVGMDAEALSRIFEPYFSTKATGTGLGLTIARRNVELIGGSIDVQSERGVGTTVKMLLPISTPL